MLLAVAAVATVVLIGACGGQSDDEDAAPPEVPQTVPGPEVTGGIVVDAEVCEAVDDVATLLDDFEAIATGPSGEHLQAQLSWDKAIGVLQQAVEEASGNRDGADALELLAQVRFDAPPDEGTGPAGDGPAGDGPTATDVAEAWAVLDDVLSDGCAVVANDRVPEPVECPAPETLEAQGLACDSEGNVYPAEPDGVVVSECPAPEVLEINGYTCDAEGNLAPIVDFDPSPECPAPEVLEENGYTCDAEGNLVPVDE